MVFVGKLVFDPAVMNYDFPAPVNHSMTHGGSHRVPADQGKQLMKYSAFWFTAVVY
jgi:hypothetical protein